MREVDKERLVSFLVDEIHNFVSVERRYFFKFDLGFLDLAVPVQRVGIAMAVGIIAVQSQVFIETSVQRMGSVHMKSEVPLANHLVVIAGRFQ